MMSPDDPFVRTWGQQLGQTPPAAPPAAERDRAGDALLSMAGLLEAIADAAVRHRNALEAGGFPPHVADVLAANAHQVLMSRSLR